MNAATTTTGNRSSRPRKDFGEREYLRFVELLRRGVEWLDSEQPKNAHTGSGIYAQKNLMPGLCLVTLHPMAGPNHDHPVLVFQKPYQTKLKGYGFTEADITLLRSAVERVAEIHETWNGVGSRFFSCSLRRRAGQSVIELVRRRYAGCPKHGQYVVCRQHNCRWELSGEHKIRRPEGWEQ